jgi:hypothetical protein
MPPLACARLPIISLQTPLITFAITSTVTICIVCLRCLLCVRANNTTTADDRTAPSDDAPACESPEWDLAERVVSSVCSGWSLSAGWKFTVKRLAKLETQYLLEAIFSIPTRRRPVPTSTASVLFSVDGGDSGFGGESEDGAGSSQLDSITVESVLRSADVVFSIETQDIIHPAVSTQFSEQWLHDILAAKRLVAHDISEDILGPRPLA